MVLLLINLCCFKVIKDFYVTQYLLIQLHSAQQYSVLYFFSTLFHAQIKGI